jgi:hypothetical protein
VGGIRGALLAQVPGGQERAEKKRVGVKKEVDTVGQFEYSPSSVRDNRSRKSFGL